MTGSIKFAMRDEDVAQAAAISVERRRGKMHRGTINKDEFYARMKTEGLTIDPKTAYVRDGYTHFGDPYGVEGFSPTKYEAVRHMHYARAPGRDDWVWFGDLPLETRAALEERLRANKGPEFDHRVERMADVIQKICCGSLFEDDALDRARALEAAQAALNALEQFDATAGESTAVT
jgi:hypothetical protein